MSVGRPPKPGANIIVDTVPAVAAVAQPMHFLSTIAVCRRQLLASPFHGRVEGFMNSQVLFLDN